MPSMRNRARCSSPEGLPTGRLIRPPAPSTRCQGSLRITGQLAQGAADPAGGAPQPGQFSQLTIADDFAFGHLGEGRVERRASDLRFAFDCCGSGLSRTRFLSMISLMASSVIRDSAIEK